MKSLDVKALEEIQGAGFWDGFCAGVSIGGGLAAIAGAVTLGAGAVIVGAASLGCGIAALK